MNGLRSGCLVALAVAGFLTASAAATLSEVSGLPATSRVFAGPKANTGAVTLNLKGGDYELTLSDGFKTPDTPAPHWQIVDSGGNTYLLERLRTMGEDDRAHRSIVVPQYIHDIAKVQIYCAWAEVVLGETTFDGVQTLMTDGSHSANAHESSRFAGSKANTGTVRHTIKDGKSTLALSDDFATPDTPAPHWRLVDSSGRTYLLQSLKTKGGGEKANRSIAIPAYVPDVAKVQIYCAWAEVVLGEASFAQPVK